MDKLRALQYFAAAAEEESFARAARRLDVSIPAVFKMVNALEHSLGARLFERNSRGIALTADGARYLESCVPALEQLAAADAAVGAAATRPSGTLVVGAPAFVLQSCLAEHVPRFHVRFPDIQLDFRIVSGVTEANAASIDVFLLLGWHDAPEMVQKRIAQTRFHVLAAPTYWSARGVPARPADLAAHSCLLFRNPEGTLLDLWEFQRGAEEESVAARGWLASSHRDFLLETALAGEGIVRFTGLTVWPHVRGGRLVPALQDWEGRHAPPVSVLYRPSQRRTPRVRLFVDFLAEIFREMEAEREGGHAAGARARPHWHGKRYARSSKVSGPA